MDQIKKIFNNAYKSAQIDKNKNLVSNIEKIHKAFMIIINIDMPTDAQHNTFKDVDLTLDSAPPRGLLDVAIDIRKTLEERRAVISPEDSDINSKSYVND